MHIQQTPLFHSALQEKGHDFRRALQKSPHQNIAELPGVAFVDIFGEEAGAIVERGPVGRGADHRADLSALAEPVRLAVLCMLRDGPEDCACKLNDKLGV